MKIAPWNFNPLNVRLSHLLDWLERERPGVVCLQETKVEDPQFPAVALEAARYGSAFADWLRAELAAHPNLVVLGDDNVAPEDRDVHDPKLWAGQVLCSEPERAAFRRLLALGLKDGFRLFDRPEKSFTWCDYRLNAFKRNMGLRIDHILVSPTVAAGCRSCLIDKTPRRLERPSDRAPVVAELAG